MSEFGDVPQDLQTLVLPEPRLGSFREWATEGTALTAAARVRDPDGRLVLVRNRWSDGWVLPGGAVEPDETPIEAARREVREETGLYPDLGAPLVVLDQSYVAESTGEEQFTAEYVVYDARADGRISDTDELGTDAGELGTDAAEITAARWFDSVPDDLHDDVLRPYLQG